MAGGLRLDGEGSATGIVLLVAAIGELIYCRYHFDLWLFETNGMYAGTFGA